MEITAAETIELIDQIRQQQDSFFEMINANVKVNVGQYLSGLMHTELSKKANNVRLFVPGYSELTSIELSA